MWYGFAYTISGPLNVCQNGPKKKQILHHEDEHPLNEDKK